MKKIDVRGMSENEIFRVVKDAGGKALTLENCMGQRYIGCGMRNIDLTLTGTPGNALASFLDGGRIKVEGNVQDAVADTMNNGEIYIDGSAGDALAYAMRGGSIFVHGSAGYRVGVHMKAYEDIQPVIVIGGKTGSFLGEYLAGGEIIVLGLGIKDEEITGYFCGSGMYAGKIYLRSEKKPLGLSEKLLVNTVSDEEKDKMIAPHVRHFCAVFSEDYEKCMDSTFISISADPLNSYKELYAAV